MFDNMPEGARKFSMVREHTHISDYGNQDGISGDKLWAMKAVRIDQS